MPTPIVVDDVAAAVRSVWAAGGGISGATAVLNKRQSQLTPPFGLLKVAEVSPVGRESDGSVIQTFEVTVQASVTDPTVTRVVHQNIKKIPAALLASGLVFWPAGVPAVPDVVPIGSGTLDTDQRPRPGGGDLFTVSDKFRVIIQPAIP